MATLPYIFKYNFGEQVQTYIAFLRAINVGSHNRIKMAKLKEILCEIGLSSIQTYLQSGNVVFKSDKNEKLIKAEIESILKISVGLDIPVLLRSIDELKTIIEKCPYSQDEVARKERLSGTKCLYFGLADKDFLLEDINVLEKYQTDAERYHITNRNIYFLFDSGVRKSKLATKLKSSITVRNLKTMQSVLDIAYKI